MHSQKKQPLRRSRHPCDSSVLTVQNPQHSLRRDSPGADFHQGTDNIADHPMKIRIGFDDHAQHLFVLEKMQRKDSSDRRFGLTG